MKFDNKTATTHKSKAQLFNEFLGSVFGPKVIADIMLPSLRIFQLEDVLITIAEVKRRLEACDDQ